MRERERFSSSETTRFRAGTHTHEYPQSTGVCTFCQEAQAAEVLVPDPRYTLYCDVQGKEPAAVRAPLPVCSMRVF